MEKDNRVFLLDILDCISAIESYLDGYDFVRFESDRKTIDGVVRNVEVIGEAANNLTEEFRAANPQVDGERSLIQDIALFMDMRRLISR